MTDAYNHPSYGQGDPGDETPSVSEPALRVIRNGGLFARRTTLGAARALIRRVQFTVGRIDCWSVMDGRKLLHREDRP
jgi:hypothetical protein